MGSNGLPPQPDGVFGTPHLKCCQRPSQGTSLDWKSVLALAAHKDPGKWVIRKNALRVASTLPVGEIRRDVKVWPPHPSSQPQRTETLEFWCK